MLWRCHKNWANNWKFSYDLMILVTDNSWLQTIWETFFHISKILYHISKLLLILLMNIVFQKKTSMLRLLTKINHFLLSLVVAWSGSSQIWSLFEHDESWCSGSVSIIRTLQSTLWTHSIFIQAHLAFWGNWFFHFENDSLTPMPLWSFFVFKYPLPLHWIRW